MEAKYKRVLLKISGEALAGDDHFGINEEMLKKVALQVKEITEMGVQVAVVVGGGNFWRGRTSKSMDRATADYMGMLATVMNAMALQDAFEAENLPTRVQTAIEMREVAEPYVRRKAISHLDHGKVVIFGAGTGMPYFSTDTTAALRAAEMQADVILLGKTGTDGIYDKDPNKFKDAKKFEELTYIEILNRGLGIMDATATSLCMDNNIPLIVFGIDNPENLVSVVKGERVGTIVRGK